MNVMEPLTGDSTLTSGSAEPLTYLAPPPERGPRIGDAYGWPQYSTRETLIQPLGIDRLAQPTLYILLIYPPAPKDLLPWPRSVQGIVGSGPLIRPSDS